VAGDPVNGVDPSGRDMYVGNTSAIGGFHQKIIVDTPTGQYGQTFGLVAEQQDGMLESLGVTPQPGLKGGGFVTFDNDQVTEITRTFKTTPVEDALIYRYLRGQLGNTGPYNVITNNCRDYSNNQFDIISNWINGLRNPGGSSVRLLQ